MPTTKKSRIHQSKIQKRQNKENDMPESGNLDRNTTSHHDSNKDDGIKAKGSKEQLELNVTNDIDDDDIDGFNNFEKFFKTPKGGQENLDKLEINNSENELQQQNIRQFQEMIRKFQLEQEAIEIKKQQQTLELFLKDSRGAQKKMSKGKESQAESTYQSPFEYVQQQMSPPEDKLEKKTKQIDREIKDQMKQDFVSAFEQMSIGTQQRKKGKKRGTGDREEEAKISEQNWNMQNPDEQQQMPPAEDLSPKTKRQMMWDLEDSMTDSQTSSLMTPNPKEKNSKLEVQVVTQDFEDSDDDDDMMDAQMFCLICNQCFDSPEESQNHMLCTCHESFEMVNPDVFEEEMKESLFSFERDPNSDDWEVMVKREFKIIFQLELDTDVALFTMCYDIFRDKIKQSMKDSISLFSNLPLKAQIFEFIQAQSKIYNCTFCQCIPFASLEELKQHMRLNEGKGCKFTEAQIYVHRLEEEK